MKKHFSLILVVLALAGIYYGKKYFLKPKNLELPKYGHYLSCIGFPYDLHVKFTSFAYLDKASLPENQNSKDNLFYSAAYFQNMYTFTNLHDYNFNTNLKWSSMSDKNPKIKIVKVEDDAYPLDLKIPSGVDIESLPPDGHDYMSKLMQRGSLSKKDPAVKVTYEYENDIHMCFSEEKVDFSRIKFLHPVDPYTAYFVVPEEERKLISNATRKAEQTVNPCLNPQAVTASTFSPFYLWFFWRPFAEGHDSNKTAFNCNNFYKENESIVSVNLSFTENTPQNTSHLAFDKFEHLDRPLAVSIFMGTLETKAFQKFNKEEGERYIERYLSGLDSITAKNELPYHKNKFDQKFSTFLWLMRNVTEQMEVKKSSYEVEEYGAEVILKGKLKLSHKDVIVKIFLNQNNPRFEGSDLFSRKFADEFLNNDIVIYGGHVNQGNVFADSFKKYGDQMKLKENKKLDYQIFALFSCTASFFFKGENFPSTSNEAFQRDLIRTGGGFSDGSANSALILLGQVDSYLYNKQYAPFGYWSKMAKSDNFYILTNH